MNPLGLTTLEVAAGMIHDAPRPPRDGSSSTLDPLDALEEACREALEGAPCIVAFSGGRDSSALLAMLVRTARRSGLPMPVAVTARWAEHASTDEDRWQEEVVRACGLADWEIIRPGEDLDLLGPEATSALRAHGLLWPPPSYVLLPLMRAAAGGTLVTGEGGDEVFGEWPFADAWAPLRSHRRPGRRELRPAVLGLSPRRVRARWFRSTRPPYQDWLRPGARHAYRRIVAADLAADPLRWSRYLRLLPRRRIIDLGRRTFQRLGEGAGARAHLPLLDPRFTKALAAAGGSTGWGNRSETMVALFDGLLPAEVLTRRTKANFGPALWSGASRSFADDWDGSGLPSELLDPEAIRRAWRAPQPVYGCALALHAAWLAADGSA